MNRKILSVLLLSTAFPMAAVAQTTAPSATGAADQTQQMDTNQNNATGGMNTTRPMGATADAGAMSETFVTVPETGAWRVSDLEGKAVYGSDGESIGDINDVLVSQDGSVNAVIIGVGGFLGIGEKDVAVDMRALELGPGASQAEANAVGATPGVSDETTASTRVDPVAPNAGTTAGDNTTAMGTGGAVTTMPADGDQMAANDAADVQIGEDGLPDRIILNVTREQHENAPAFAGVDAAQN